MPEQRTFEGATGRSRSINGVERGLVKCVASALVGALARLEPLAVFFQQQGFLGRGGVGDVRREPGAQEAEVGLLPIVRPLFFEEGGEVLRKEVGVRRVE